MGTWFYLKIGQFAVLSGKSDIPAEVLSIFSERDRIVLPEQDDASSEDVWDETDDLEDQESDANLVSDEEYFRYLYQISVAELSHRLDVMGFTMTLCRNDYEKRRKAEIEYLKSELALFEPDNTTDPWLLSCQGMLQNWMQLDFDAWLYEMKELLDRNIGFLEPRIDKDLASTLSTLQTFMVDIKGDRSYFSYLHADFRSFIRVLLHDCPNSQSHIGLLRLC